MASQKATVLINASGELSVCHLRSKPTFTCYGTGNRRYKYFRETGNLKASTKSTYQYKLFPGCLAHCHLDGLYGQMAWDATNNVEDERRRLIRDIVDKVFTKDESGEAIGINTQLFQLFKAEEYVDSGSPAADERQVMNALESYKMYRLQYRSQISTKSCKSTKSRGSEYPTESSSRVRSTESPIDAYENESDAYVPRPTKKRRRKPVARSSISSRQASLLDFREGSHKNQEKHPQTSDHASAAEDHKQYEVKLPTASDPLPPRNGVMQDTTGASAEEVKNEPIKASAIDESLVIDLNEEYQEAQQRAMDLELRELEEEEKLQEIRLRRAGLLRRREAMRKQ